VGFAGQLMVADDAPDQVGRERVANVERSAVDGMDRVARLMALGWAALMSTRHAQNASTTGWSMASSAYEITVRWREPRGTPRR
jgi:hypothetical protein